MADDFERDHLSGQGRVFGRSKIPVPRYFLALSVLGPVGATAMLIFAGGFAPLAAVGIGVGMGAVGFFGNLALLGVRTVISEGGIEVTSGVMRVLHLDLAEVESFGIVDVRLRDFPLGRSQVKRGRGGVAYGLDIGVKRGVEVRTKKGKRHVLCSHDPEALASALEAALQHASGGASARVRVDAESEPEVAEVPVERDAKNAEAATEG